MLLMPGDRDDYDRWAELDGCSGWDSGAMAPWLAKATDALGYEVRTPDLEVPDLIEAFDDAFGILRLRPAGNTLETDRCGLFTPALATNGGARRSVADAYLDLDNPNLTVLTGRTAVSLAVEHGSAKGIVLSDGETVPASTVVLTAGLVGTARLLHQTGGIGNVGDWVKNHEAAAVVFPWPGNAGGLRTPEVLRVARWSSETVEGAATTGRFRLDPDLMAILMGPFQDSGHDIGTILVTAATTRSTGRLELDSMPQRLVSNRLAHPDDMARLRTGTRTALKVCRRLGRLSGGGRRNPAHRLVEELEGLGDRELESWVRSHPGPVYHAVGSCRMGASASTGAVAAAEPGRAGSVHGLKNVVVADASLFPDLVSGGLQLPVMAVAERVTAETLLGSRIRV